MNRRVVIAGHRIHHGFTGIALIVIGATLVAHDRRDWRLWFRDLMLPAPWYGK